MTSEDGAAGRDYLRGAGVHKLDLAAAALDIGDESCVDGAWACSLVSGVPFLLSE